MVFFFSRDIDKGELILTEKALGCGPNHTLEAWHCLDCLKPMEQLNRYIRVSSSWRRKLWAVGLTTLWRLGTVWTASNQWSSSTGIIYHWDKGELILTEKALDYGPNHTLEAWHCLDCLKPMEQLNRYYIPFKNSYLHSFIHFGTLFGKYPNFSYTYPTVGLTS